MWKSRTTDGKAKTAQADRGWQITYQRKKDLRGDVTLKFPALKSSVTTTNVEFKHYRDADLVSVDAKQAAAGVVLRSGGSTLARNVGLGVGVLAVAFGLFALARRKPAQVTVPDGLALPAQLTPFSVVAFLRRIQREHAAKLDEGKRRSLTAQIRELESAFFSGGNAAAGAPDLESVARKWMQAVG
jgi:hypothetical protein